jgi:hypothetical protein
VSMHEFVASLKEHFHHSRPQLTEQEVTEIRNRLRDLLDNPTDRLKVETASGAEQLPISRTE